MSSHKEEVPRIVWNKKVSCSAYKRSPLVFVPDKASVYLSIVSPAILNCRKKNFVKAYRNFRGTYCLSLYSVRGVEITVRVFATIYP
jgi:hypothetical protein